MGDERIGQETLTTAQITVFNQSYRVTSADNGKRAAMVARLVDTRMRETAAQITTHDVARIAVLTALQIADELLTLKEINDREPEVAAAPDENHADPAPSGNGEAPLATPRGTWFESIFDSELSLPETREGRMGSNLSERLRTARQTEIESDAMNDGPEVNSD
jgi:cell division protein ZapA (FtsZ GTPase activity inhibitor)